MDLTEDQKIWLGEFCENTLRDDAFAFITNQYETSTVQQLLSTKPQDRERRDELYFAVRGVKDLLSMMAQFVQEKDRLLDPTPQPSEDDLPVDMFEVDASEDAAP